MGNRCGSDIRYVSLPRTRMARPVVCSCSQCVIERRGCDARVPHSFEELHSPFSGPTVDRRRSGARTNILRNPENSDLMISEPGEPTTCQSRGASINFAIDVSFSRFRAPLNYRLGINFPPSLPLCPWIYLSFSFFFFSNAV